MKEKIRDCYLRKIRVRPHNSSGNYTTVAYKPGIADVAANRDTKNDFGKLWNANPKSNIAIANRDGGVADDIIIEENLVISGPGDSFIKPLEDFLLNEVFQDDARVFDTKNEFIAAGEESFKKYDEACKVLNTIMSDHGDLINAYKEIVDGQQQSLLDNIMNQYSKILLDFKNAMNKFLTPFSPPKVAVKTPTNTIVATVVSPPKIPLKDVYTCLKTDFVLCKGQGKMMLMHKIYHKGKNPFSSDGSWKTDISNNQEPKFQFHNTDVSSKFGYKQNSAQALKCIKIFGSDIIDLDDPLVDKSRLP